MKCCRVGRFGLLLLCFLAAAGWSRAEETVRITEFLAVNNGPLTDEDGEFSDWIEIHNSGTNTVDLNGWYLTDRASQLTQWRFPSTNLGPNAYLIVFASGKDRRVPGAPLHTNFRLNDTGEYLGLIQPDGVTVASAFAPRYPIQVEGVSYGFPVEQTVTTLIASGATARVFVPFDASLSTDWTMTGFDDSGWFELNTGVGYEADGQVPFMPVTLADSVADFSGTQGQNNWFYGYWDKKNDADGTYADTEFVPFPNDSGGFGVNNFWTGVMWDWFNGDPPFTQLSRQGAQPSADIANPTEPTHWAIRRYICQTNGAVRITGTLTHTSDWVRVTASGTASSALLYLYLADAGQGYIDDLSLVRGLIPEVGQNLIANGDFETALTGPWTVSPILANSEITTAVKHSGNSSLHIVATAAGASQGTAIWQVLAGLTANQTYTLSYWYLPPTNSPPATVRFSGSWILTTPAPCGDGIVGRILVDGHEVFQQNAYVSSMDFGVSVLANLGSRIDFVVDAGPADDDECDNATFTTMVRTDNPAAGVVADSAADWSRSGTQGEKNWYYGYYDKTADADHIYAAEDFVAFPHDNGPQSPSNFWDQEEWDWFNGNPPYDKIGQYWMLPNGSNHGPEHWVIRRWVSQVSGELTLEWRAFKELPDQNNPGGGGVTVRIFHNGVPRDVSTVAGGDVSGVRRMITLNDVAVGDTIDIALDPTNLDGRPDDDTDRTFVTAVLRGTPSLTSQIVSDVAPFMHGINATAYLRFPFTVSDPSAFNSLTLRLKYDDSFVAYLNGSEVARANAPLPAEWNSSALTARPDADANQYMEFNLNTSLDLLRPGANVLAIHGLNAGFNDGDFLILPELLATSVTEISSSPRYFMISTPGVPNGYGNTNLGPLIVTSSHTPNVPKDTEDLVVTASVSPTFNPVNTVRLIYRVMYSNEINVPMFDDGLHGDGAASDGTFGATIPASASKPGEMVRYYVFATDTEANSTRFPAYLDPQNSPQYQGTVVFNPALTNPLPVLHFFVRDPVLATNYVGTRASLFWDDEFYDNIGVNAHGQTTWYVFAKRSMDFNLNTGHKLRWKPGEERIKAFDLLTPASDKAYMRLLLAFETFRDAGVPTHFAFPVRLQQNNAFHSIMHFVEQANDDLLARNGLDPNGALYKIYFPLTNAYAGAKKVTRQNEPNDDLQELIDGCLQTGPPQRQYVYDHVDIPEFINFLAAIQLVQNEDCCWYKNYYLYRDSHGNGEWQMLPWDLDLTFGRTFKFFVVSNLTINGYFDTNIYWTNAYYTQNRALYDYIGVSHTIVDALWTQPEIYDMFLRRWTTVQEEFLQQTNTHPLARKFERRVDELASQIGPDAVLDYAKWATWFPTQSLAVASSILKTEYFGRRRGWIFNTLRFANGGPYLGSQPTNTALLIGDIEFNPATGNQRQEYVQIRNPNSYAADISGWKVGGAIQHTFRPGTVIPAGGTIYLSPDVNAFRARTIGPRGGQGLFLQGDYQGQLSARGELVQLTDKTGRLVRTTNYVGNPSPAQRYLRITEIMYHPAAPPSGAYSPEDFEYVELKNIGPTPLSLTGVHFANGIEFNFTGSSIASLDPGQSVLVVRNAAAFASRYGGGFPIAGQYSGALDNSGENLRLEDASNEKILDFDYNNSWYPITDGFGFSLAIVDDTASWDTWGQKLSWRPSGGVNGSPGQENPPATTLAAVFVNEVLTATDAPVLDAIELYNPTPNDVDLGGWFITDDFNTPKKYRIPDGISIGANSYRVFDEEDFNPVGPPAATKFSFSSNGDEVYLFSGDAAGDLTGYYHGFSFGAAANGVSFGRHVTSLGQEHFVAQTLTTLGQPNGGPLVGPVVISEIMFHPPDLPGGEDNGTDEFVELENVTNADVPLYDTAASINGWHLRGGVNFDFPAGTSLTAHSRLLLVSFDPANSAQLAAFRNHYGLTLDVPIFGPYTGKLDNSADSVQLFKPDVSAPGEEVPYILVDAVDYEDSTPWPNGADGAGASLQRRLLSQYGNDPVHWTAAVPTSGQEFGGGIAPSITMQPAGQLLWAFGNASFTVAATGAVPLRYQWRINGTNLAEATNATLTVANVQPFQDAAYSVVVFNAAGSVVSSNAALTVVLPILITAQPQSLLLALNSNATFTVQAVSGRPIQYQWRFDGEDVPGATNASYVITNVQTIHAGTYAVTLRDSFGTVVSSNATLTLRIRPTLTLQPLSQTAVPGGSVTFTIAATGTTPISFRWRRNNLTFTGGGIISTPTNSSLTLTNIQLGDATNFYNVAVTNIAGVAPLSSNAFLTVLLDTDGDGLPDEWELTTAGFDPNFAADATFDYDLDGMDNLSEYIAGTDYLDPYSYLKADITAVGSTAISFNAVAHRSYTVQYTDGLNPAQWKKLRDVLVSDVTRTEMVLDANPSPNRYYRLVIPVQPPP